MRIYEELFIVKPDATEEEVDQLIEQMKGIVTKAGGVINKVDKWGKRRLAYKVDKYREGEYVLMEFQAEAEAVSEFERRLRVQDIVIKFLTVRIDETMKRIEKRKKHREKRASRKASAAPATPLPSVAQQMLGEGAPPVPGAPVPGTPVQSAAPAAPAVAAPGLPVQS